MRVDEFILLIIATTLGYGIWWIFKGIYLAITYKERKLRREYNEYLLETVDINALDDRDFEIFCAEVFKKQGFEVELTKATGDYGRDIILNNSIYVECKRFNKKGSVGRPILQKLLGSMDMFGINKGIIITTGKYSNTAIEAARISGKLILWDSYDLFRFLKADKEKAQKMVLG
ncbi:MAG: restriction endonuclease [Veillonella parvula]|uniref:Restriction endonuclease n=1 Tax=Veillonella parvula TaxID=29466 RepID=A0A942WPA9_VEIPA|nr:restriction endonuclease [Veillonella parvula]MBS4893837.1 restriction endonuclease [Veillonella parvula]